MRQFVLSRIICASSVALTVVLIGCVRDSQRAPGPKVAQHHVGRVEANVYQTSTGQRLTPTGRQIKLPGMRPQTLALSPDGNLLATAGNDQKLVLIDPVEGRILQTVRLSITNKTESKSETVTAQISFAGIIFSPDGRRIYLSNTGGNIWVFPVEPGGRVGRPKILAVPAANAPDQKHEIPTGLAVSADGKRLYVAGNLGNRLHEMDAESGKVLRSWDTGAVPFDVVLAGDKAYVSNLGGRRPASGDLAALAGKGTTVRVDPVRYIANEGSVTVIDLAAGEVKTEILVGLHASGLAVSPGGKYVVVANSGSDTLNVIETATDRVIEKIWARQTPADLFGAQPIALAFDSSRPASLRVQRHPERRGGDPVRAGGQCFQGFGVDPGRLVPRRDTI